MSEILYNITDRIATITINRPDTRNALSHAMRRELLAAVRRAENDTAVRVVILTGAGDAFCAGGDINVLRELKQREDADGFAQLLEEGSQVVDSLRRMPKPTIAKVNGPAFGGGFILAIACDLRLVSETASFGVPFARLGLGPDWGATFILPRLIGTSRALELLYTGARVDAQTALAIGLINQVFAPDQLDAAVDAWAQDLTVKPAAVLARYKRAVYETMSRSFDDTAALERRLQLENFRSPDFAEGISAFLEKRTPRFGDAAVQTAESPTDDTTGE